MTGNLEKCATEWKLHRVLTAPTIEDWVATLPATTKRVIVRLGSWHRTGPFADARLQSALCLLHRKNIETIAIVPPVTLKGNRAALAFADPLQRVASRPCYAKLSVIRPTERMELSLAEQVKDLGVCLRVEAIHAE